MRQSNLFTKTRREAPSDETAKNAQLLIRGGYIKKEMAGAYDYLPLGLKVLRNIENIVRKEINIIGGQEVLMTTLQDPTLWQKSDRWGDEKVDNWFKSELKAGGEVGIANTHEEPVTNTLTHFVNSYKDLPLYIYQFQTKFRNELRAKSGLMRAKEFLMKDLYSFSLTEEDFKNFYEKCAEAYIKIFEKVGLGEVTFRTVAAGGSFTEGFTDEFQTLSSAGEDTIYLDRNKKLAVNKEVYNPETLLKYGLKEGDLEEVKSIEVGNIFPLGTKYAEALNLKVKTENGEEIYPIMGSYGIGLGRLMGTVVEVLSDDKGIVWPETIAPFKYHLINLSPDGDSAKNKAEEIYKTLGEENVLYDDRDLRAGEKFADADLLGFPYQIIVSDKNFAEDKIEIKVRKTGETKHLNMEEITAL